MRLKLIKMAALRGCARSIRMAICNLRIVYIRTSQAVVFQPECLFKNPFRIFIQRECAILSEMHTLRLKVWVCWIPSAKEAGNTPEY